MANYNTFVVQVTKTGRTLLVTSSARKIERFPLAAGLRVEVWNENAKVETIYFRTREKIKKYTAAEKEYIRAKQAAAEHRNRLRRARRESST
jgi:hypothetical protein